MKNCLTAISFGNFESNVGNDACKWNDGALFRGKYERRESRKEKRENENITGILYLFDFYDLFVVCNKVKHRSVISLQLYAVLAAQGKSQHQTYQNKSRFQSKWNMKFSFEQKNNMIVDGMENGSSTAKSSDIWIRFNWCRVRMRVRVVCYNWFDYYFLLFRWLTLWSENDNLITIQLLEWIVRATLIVMSLLHHNFGKW